MTVNDFVQIVQSFTQCPEHPQNGSSALNVINEPKTLATYLKIFMFVGIASLLIIKSILCLRRCVRNVKKRHLFCFDCRSQWPLACWDRGFESYRWHESLSVVSVMCCQVEVSAANWSLVQRSPTDCGVLLCVIKKPREWGGHSPRWAEAASKKITLISRCKTWNLCLYSCSKIP
jgi:hypothetical protein